MTSSTTPQDRATALKVVHAALRDNNVIGPGVLYAADCAVKALADAGLLSSDTQEDQGDGSLRSEPAALGDDSAVYVRLSNRAVNETVSHYEGTAKVDMDDYGQPVGVEILGAVAGAIDGRVVGLEYE